MLNKIERYTFQPEDFQGKLDSILSRKLTTENIDTYGSDALDDLVTLTTDVSEQYKSQPTVRTQNEMDTEDAAFNYFKLKNIEEILDHVADIADSIGMIDDVIMNMPQANSVFLPPGDLAGIPFAEKSGRGYEKRLVQRTKAILFLLQERFNLDITDSDQVSLRKGRAPEGSVRDEPYVSIELSSLNRFLLVNDELGNVTFAFDTSMKIGESNFNAADIECMTKQEINELILTHPNIGARINYYEDWYLQHVEEALRNEFNTDGPKQVVEYSQSYLRPTAPTDYESRNGFANRIEIDVTSVHTAIKELGDNLGEMEFFDRKGQLRPLLSPAQQDMVKEWLIDKGYFRDSPEGFKSIPQFALEVKYDHKMLRKLIDSLSEELGEIGMYRSLSGPPSPQLSLAQQDMLSGILQEKGYLTVIPDTYLSISNIADKIGVQHITAQRAVARTDGLTPVLGRKAGGMGRPTTYYSEEDTEKIAEAIRNSVRVKRAAGSVAVNSQ